jgi:hypothetical protein
MFWREKNMKCEWKDGKFYGCNKSINGSTIGIEIARGLNRYIGSHEIWFCPFCGADIRKPKKTKPIVKPSGKTFVASYDGVDYLCIKKGMYETSEEVIEDAEQNTSPLYHKWWKSIDEIESEGITDEIAMLRPIMIDDETNTLYTLWGVDVGFCVTGNGCIPVEELRIARVGDLP